MIDRRWRAGARELVVASGLVLGLMLLGGCAAEPTGADAPNAPSPHATSERSVEPTARPAGEPATPSVTIAWQPSHQDDTGVDWHECVVCGDIVDRVIELLPEYDHVKAWDTSHGLTGTNNYRPAPTNTQAFDAELAMSNSAHANVFVAVHVDGGAPSGILGECMPDDPPSRSLCEAMVASICAETDLPDRGVREVRLYSLEPDRNAASLRVLLELGDNAADREMLLSDPGREQLARGIAAAVRTAVPADATF